MLKCKDFSESVVSAGRINDGPPLDERLSDSSQILTFLAKTISRGHIRLQS